MQKANSVGSIVGMRRRGRFCASCQIWRGISGRKFPETSWNEKRMLKATHRPPQACRPPNENCSRKYFAGGPLERAMGAGPTARSGLRPNPRGGCAPAICSKVKTSPQRPKHLAQCAGKLEAVAVRLALSKSQIRKEARRRSFAPPPGSSFDYKMLL